MSEKAKQHWQKVKQSVHDIRLYPQQTPLAGWSSGDGMVYTLNPAFLEIGQGANSPMRGWGAIVYLSIILGVFPLVYLGVMSIADNYRIGGIEGINIPVVIGLLFTIGLGFFSFRFFGKYLWRSFFSVTDPTVRFDFNRQKVWMWTGNGPIEMNWANLVPRVESSVATAYTTVQTYRGQYAEDDGNGQIKTTGNQMHLFQVGQLSASAEGALSNMEYIRLYMEKGPAAVRPPEKYLSHRAPWHALVNLFGMADDWILWQENRHRPGLFPPPWGRTITFILFFPVFFPLQFTNWLALTTAPRPKWPKALEEMHQGDLSRFQSESQSKPKDDLQVDPAREEQRPTRKAVIRVNGEIISGND